MAVQLVDAFGHSTVARFRWGVFTEFNNVDCTMLHVQRSTVINSRDPDGGVSCYTTISVPLSLSLVLAGSMLPHLFMLTRAILIDSDDVYRVEYIDTIDVL